MPAARGTVLIVEDSPESAALLSSLVEGEGFAAEVAHTAADAISAHRRVKPVAVLLDWGLADGPGTEVCRQIRAGDDAVAVLFVSGRDDETSIARGLDAGADDYVAKPVRAGELMARLEAHVRRASALGRSATAARSSTAAVVRFGPIEVDFDARELRREGRPVRLGALEFKLLEYLVTNAGRAVSRDQILSEVYGYDADISSERVDLLVRRLRGKLGEPDGWGAISAIPGYGYRLDRRGSGAEG